MDVLSDALRVVRLKGALFLNAEFGEPWCVDAPSGETLAALLAPVHKHMAILHLIVEGRCWAQLAGSEAVVLEAGDVVVLPRGEAHLLGSGTNHAPVHVRHTVALELPKLASARYGGDGACTTAICGWFAYDHHIASPVLAALPRMFTTSIRRRPSGHWIESSIRYAVEQAQEGGAGSSVVADRLAEVLFVEALRGYIETLPERETGWFVGLRDPVVGRCIALMHERLAEDWTVAALAEAVGVSRTVLAERFGALVGAPPMQYLARWRAAVAAHLLREGHLTLARIAEEIGYDSESAFSRAFKREYGAPPASWRRQLASSLA